MTPRLSTLNKIFIPTGILFIILTVTISTLTAIVIRETFIDHVRQTVAGLIKTEARNLLPEDFFGLSQERTQEAFSQLFSNIKSTDIVRIKVWNISAEVIYSDDPDIINKRFPDNKSFIKAIKGEIVVEQPGEVEESEGSYVSPEAQLLEVYVPVVFPGEYIPAGVIEIYYRSGVVRDQIFQSQLILVYAIAIFAIVTYIMLLIFFRRVIFKPIQELKLAAASLESGNLSGRVALISKDEIGDLSTSFNKMAMRLQGYYENLEERVKERTELVRKVVDTNPNQISVKDTFGKFTLVNQALAGLYGKSVDEMLGKNLAEVTGDEDEFLRTFKEEKRVIKTRLPKLVGEDPLVNPKTKEVRWFQTIRVPLFSDGSARHVLTVSTDITDRKKSEQRIRELDELKSRFIKIVSHQLRTPLSSIGWNLELLLGGDVGKMTEGQEELIRLAYNSGKDVVARIDDLLTALEIEEKKIRLEKESAQIESLVRSVIDEFTKEIEIKGINLTSVFPEKPLSAISIDTPKIRMVIRKLFENAVNYTKEKGKIEVRVTQTAGKIHFEVSDSGIGIPQAEQSNTFQRFHRASNAFTLKPDLSGLGLFIAKSFVEAHSGIIGFYSQEGKGSTFWFELPLL